VKHITAAERTLWNTVSSKLPLAGGTLTGFLTLHAAPTANMHAATKKYVDDSMSSAGNGDMLKSVYDTNGNGIVDNAEKVNGLTVLTAVPANAKFTDTTYSAMTGATTSAAGSVGLVPAPTAGAATRYLRSDGTWQVPPDNNTTYSNATTTTAGLMSAADKVALDNHIASKLNPHGVTASQVGLGNVDNTADTAKPVSTAQAAAIKVVQDDVTAHKGDTSNPHSVTKAQVGLGSVPNVATNDQTPTYTAASAPAALSSGEKLSVAFGKLAAGISALITHLANTANPHSVTKAQVGLGNVDNTADSAKSVASAVTATNMDGGTY
jgi:hypothetical protein